MTVIAEPLACNLPDLPAPLTDAVGYPAHDGSAIYVSKSDWAQVGGYLLGLQQWIIAASGCITGRVQ